MYARLAFIFFLVLPLLVSAARFRHGGVLPAGSCNPAGLQCCASSHAATSSTASAIMRLVGVNSGTVTGLVGLNCNPITANLNGFSGTSCDNQPLCCSDNSFKGYVAFGCAPIDLLSRHSQGLFHARPHHDPTRRYRN